MTDESTEGAGEQGSYWTEPDRSEERWLQPWEERPDRDSAMLDDWWKAQQGPRYGFAFLEWLWIDFGCDDFFSPRARFVSDR